MNAEKTARMLLGEDHGYPSHPGLQVCRALLVAIEALEKVCDSDTGYEAWKNVVQPALATIRGENSTPRIVADKDMPPEEIRMVQDGKLLGVIKGVKP